MYNVVDSPPTPQRPTLVVRCALGELSVHTCILLLKS
jgi:hypothetical protein